MRHVCRGLGLLALLASSSLLILASEVAAQREGKGIELSVESNQLYAGLPFVLSVQVAGLAEQPEPEVSTPQIPGCTVTHLGMTPSVSSTVTIINGRRSESRNVVFVFRFRVEAPRAGRYSIGPVTATQGSDRLVSRQAAIEVKEVSSTDDMQVRLLLPERPISVGETFEVTIDWYLKRDVGNHTFVVPFFNQTEWIQIHPPAADPNSSQRTLSFSAGASEIQLPFERDQVDLGGSRYTRFRVRTQATPLKPGVLAVPPTRVLAELHVGMGRDTFGFPVSRARLFRAEDTARRLEIRPLPQAGRPRSYSNAIGTSYTIEAQADRTVVQAGDPIELRITVRGDGQLAGMILPPLDADGGLSRDLFSFPDDPPTGELLAGSGSGGGGGGAGGGGGGGGGKSGASTSPRGKIFRVAVRVRSERVHEIPPIALSYFNPTTGQYHTVRSLPIALSVRGSAVVGADQVVSSAAAAGKPANQPQGGAAGGAGTGAGAGSGAGARASTGAQPNLAISTIGADLAQSSGDRTTRRSLTTRGSVPGLLLLYGIPLLILGLKSWRRRTETKRQAEGERRAAMRLLDKELELAASRPAREAAPSLLAAIKALERAALDFPTSETAVLVERLETEAYDPRAANRPIDPSLIAAVRAAAARTQERPDSSSSEAMASSDTPNNAIPNDSNGTTPNGRGGGTGATATAATTATTGTTAKPGLPLVLLLTSGSLLSLPVANASATATNTTARANASASANSANSGGSGGSGGSGDTAGGGDQLERARQAYRDALGETDRTRRMAAFATTARLLEEEARRHPGCPELLADWGNALLGAHELGKATLAYRRALLLDPRMERARRNLEWIRSAQPEWLPRPRSSSAVDSLLFWHRVTTPAERLLAGGIAFALAVLLLTPFARSPGRRRLLQRTAMVPAIIWLALALSAVLERSQDRDAVVVEDGAVLRSADSVGAPPALANPLPAGAETIIQEERGPWIRVTLPNGTRGWLGRSSVERVADR
ncbi:MAG: BatD family protein [Pseudomonadota bacterium]